MITKFFGIEMHPLIVAGLSLILLIIIVRQNIKKRTNGKK